MKFYSAMLQAPTMKPSLLFKRALATLCLLTGFTALANDKPIFTVEWTSTFENIGPVNVPGFAHDIHKGSAVNGVSSEDTSQGSPIAFFITANDNPRLFSSQPTISPDG